MHNHKKEECCSCADGVDELIGSALTDKLMSDTDAAARVTGEDILRVVTNALKIRSGLLTDELSHLSEKAREEALTRINLHHVNRILCGLLNATVLIGISAGETAATYIGHAAAHFENEIMRRAMGPIVDAQAQRIKEDAEMRTGSNN